MKYFYLFLSIAYSAMAIDNLDELKQSHDTQILKLAKLMETKEVSMAQKLKDLQLKLKQSFMASANLDAALYMDSIIKGEKTSGEVPIKYQNLLKSYEKSLKKTKLAYKQKIQEQLEITRTNGQELISTYLRKSDLSTAKNIKSYIDQITLNPQSLHTSKSTTITKTTPTKSSKPNANIEQQASTPSTAQNTKTDLASWIVGTWKLDNHSTRVFQVNNTSYGYSGKVASPPKTIQPWQVQDNQIILSGTWANGKKYKVPILKIDENTYELIVGKNRIRATRVASSSSQTTSITSDLDKIIVGKWSIKPGQIAKVFNADGSGYSHNGDKRPDFKWKVGDNKILIEAGKATAFVQVITKNQIQFFHGTNKVVLNRVSTINASPQK